MMLLINISWISLHSTKNILGVTDTLSSSQIIALTNLERTKAGVETVKPNEKLTKAAQAKAANMIESENFDHYYTSDGQTIDPWQFILDAEYNYLHAGENLGKDFFDSQSLVQAWIDSPAHKANLLSPQYSEIGVAVVEGPYLGKDNTTLVVQLFATPITDPSQVPIQPNEVSVAPLIENQETWVNDFFAQYPVFLFGLTSMVHYGNWGEHCH